MIELKVSSAIRSDTSNLAKISEENCLAERRIRTSIELLTA
jgi:hypothetical protein